VMDAAESTRTLPSHCTHWISCVSFDSESSALRHTVPLGMDRKETDVYLRLDSASLPRHIAIIMDGNGRWARRRHMPRVAGHRAGVAAVRSTVETAARAGIPALTLYAFSEENWKKRPKTEVDFLMRLLCHYLKAEIKTLNQNNVRLQYIGRKHELPESVQREMAEASDATSKNTGMLLTLALNYSARSEIVDAFRSLAEAAARNGGLDHIEVNEQAISEHLYTRGLPDPDLVIRTSGEMRLSNFLLWQLAYAEIYVTQTLWPDFRGVQLLEGIEEYQKRDRRYGGLGPDGHAPQSNLCHPERSEGPAVRGKKQVLRFAQDDKP
jgi:undecaprenyl diphosphate synthase